MNDEQKEIAVWAGMVFLAALACLGMLLLFGSACVDTIEPPEENGRLDAGEADGRDCIVIDGPESHEKWGFCTYGAQTWVCDSEKCLPLRVQ